MKLASHNSMTYLKPEKWWMYPFNFMAKCQDKAIDEQYDKGVRWFDLRIGFNKDGIPKFKHGLMTYKANVDSVIEWLINKNDVIIRITSEDDKPGFIDFCRYLENTYGHRFCGGHRKIDYKKIYNFTPVIDYNLIEKYSSVPGNPKIYSIWPWLYAKLHNKENKKNYIKNSYLMLDFIDVG